MSEIPADLMATNSKLSPRLPNVISEESKTDKGKASGINTALWYQINFKIVAASSPFPTKSSIHSQKNCMINTNSVMKKVATNGPIKAFIMSLSNFFTCLIVYLYLMQSAKIRLSSQHIKLVTNADWILTKNEILLHIKTAFEDLYHWQQSTLKSYLLPAEVLKPGGKISRGENYLGLPWIVLDNPRHFVKGNIFAVRTLFWWGRFFSTTLHVSGIWQQKVAQQLINAFDSLQQTSLRICYSGDEWVHDIHSQFYTPLNEMDKESFGKIIKEAPFVKIAAHTSIENIENSIEILMQQFEFLVSILGDDS